MDGVEAVAGVGAGADDELRVGEVELLRAGGRVRGGVGGRGEGRANTDYDADCIVAGLAGVERVG